MIDVPTEAVDQIFDGQERDIDTRSGAEQAVDAMFGISKHQIDRNLVQEPNADTAASIFDMKTKDNLNFPYATLRNEQETFLKQSLPKDFDFEASLKKSPKLTNMMREVDKAAVIKDDFENLGFFETIGQDIVTSFIRGEKNVRSSDIGVKMILGQELTPFEEVLFMLPSQEIDTGFFQGIPGAVAENIPLLIDVLGDAATDTGLASLIGGTAAVVTTKNPSSFVPAATATARFIFPLATTFEFAKTEAGLAMLEFSQITDDEGNPIEHEIAVGASLIVGTINGLLERVGFKAQAKTFTGAKDLLSKLIKNRVKKQLLQEGFIATARRVAQGALRAGVTEGITEGLQETVNILGDQGIRALTDLDLKTFGELSLEEQNIFVDEALGRVLASVEAGAQAGLGFGIVGGVVTEVSNNSIRNETHKDEQEVIEDAKQAAKRSKTLARSKELFNEITTGLLPENSDYYLRAQKFNEFFQDDIELMKEFQEFVPEAAEQIEEATRLGGDLVLPANKVSAALASEKFENLKIELRITQESVTDSEFSEVSELSVAKISEIAEIFETQADFVKASIEEDVLATGAIPEEAEGIALLHKNFYQSLQERNAGVDTVLDDFYGTLRVQREVTGRPRRKDLTDVGIEDLQRFARTGRGATEEVTTPVTQSVIESGKIAPESPAAVELATRDITPQNFPSLFEEGGLTDLDQIVAEEVGLQQVEDTGLAAPDDVLDAIATERNQEAEPTDIARTVEALEAEGIDVAEADPADIRKILEGEEFFQEDDGGESTKFGSTRFGNEEIVISVFEKANLSTLLHETGHVFLEGFTRVAAHESASEQTKKDLQTLLEWFEIDSVDQIDHAQHEQWARGFEKYVAENDAPNAGLRRVFRAFRVWLVNVYKDLRALNVDVTPEVKEVMDRMLATDLEIEQAASLPAFLPDPIIMDQLTEPEQQRYLEMRNNSIDIAKERLLQKSLKQTEKTLTKTYDNARKKFRKEATTLVNLSPVYQSIHALQRGKQIDGTDLPEGFPDEKLDRKQVFDVLGVNNLKFLPKSLTQAKGGVHPDIIADLFGFNSGAEWLTSMIDIPTRTEQIEIITQAALDKEFGNMLEDGTIEIEAINALENIDRTELLLFELDALSREGIEGRRFARQEFEIEADRILGEIKVNQLRPSGFYTNEVKAARESGKLAAQGDLEGASVWKKRQILNHITYRKATKFVANRDKALEKFRKLSKAPEKLKIVIDPVYHEQIITLLERFNIGSVAKPETIKKVLREAEQDLERRQDINEFAELIIPEIVKNLDKPNIKDMTVDEFNALKDTIITLEKRGRAERIIVVEGERLNLEQQAEQAAAIILDNIPTLDQKELAIDKRDKIVRKRTRAFINVSTKMETWVQQMDGGTLGFINERLRQGIFDAENQRSLRLRDEMKTFQDEILFKHYGKTKLPKTNIFITVENLRNQRLFINDKVGSLTREQVISVALNWGNEGNRSRILNDSTRNWEISDVNLILSKMREKDWEFVQETWDFLDKFWPEISALERKRTGVSPEKVAAAPVRTEFGILKGGYYPIKFDRRRSSAVAANDAKTDFKSLLVGKFGRAQTKRGHTETRATKVDLPIQLTMDTITNHINQVVHDLTMSEAIDNAYKFLKHKNFREAVSKTLGTEVFTEMDLWIKDVAVGQVIASSEFERALRGLRASITVGTMAWKYTTTAVQILGLTQTSVELGNKWMAKGLFNYMKNPRNAVREVLELSEFMQTRQFQINRDMSDALKLVSNSKILTDFESVAFYPIIKMQQVVDTITWMGAYDKFTAQNPDTSETQAIKFADKLVETSQSSSAMSSLSAVERGTIGPNTRLNELVKAFTTFYSYFNTKFNIAFRKGSAFKRLLREISDNEDLTTLDKNFEAAKASAQIFSDYVILFWLEAVLSEILLGRVNLTDDDDEDLRSFSFHAKLTMANAFGTLPVIRDGASAIQGFGGDPATTRAIQNLFGGGISLGKAAFTDDEVNWYKVSRSLISSANVASPVKFPAGQINQFVRGLEQNSKGEDPSFFDYLRFNDKKQ